MIPTATLYSKEQAPGRAGVIVTLALHGPLRDGSVLAHYHRLNRA